MENERTTPTLDQTKVPLHELPGTWACAEHGYELIAEYVDRLFRARKIVFRDSDKGLMGLSSREVSFLVAGYVEVLGHQIMQAVDEWRGAQGLNKPQRELTPEQHKMSSESGSHRTRAQHLIKLAREQQACVIRGEGLTKSIVSPEVQPDPAGRGWVGALERAEHEEPVGPGRLDPERWKWFLERQSDCWGLTQPDWIESGFY